MRYREASRGRATAFSITTITLAAVTLLVLSCGDGAVEPTPPPAPVATTVTVTPAAAELSALGATTRLSAQVRDQNGRVMAGASVAWSSSSASVATVDASGVVTAAANGAATITATSGAASGSAAVTVAQAVSAVAITPAADTLVVADTVRLSAAASDENGNRVAAAEFVWASSDAGVVRVDVTGLVTGVGEGRATVTATVGEASATSVLTVVNPDRAALAAFYEATGGPSWVDNTNWLTDAPLEEWHGVGTDASGRVVTLDLYENNLVGRIPPEAGGLSALLRLTLNDNRLTLTGDSFAGLQRLQHLYLRRNELGALPEGIFDGLHDLRTLLLDVNPLTELSEDVFAGLANLRVLYLGHTQVVELPGTLFRDLVHLDNLSLYANRKLTTLPPDLFRGLVSLSHLDLVRNALESLPGGLLDDLVNLRTLWLQSNRLTGLPRFSALPKLEQLILDTNSITSVPAAAFEGLSGLRELSLANNQLTQLPEGIFAGLALELLDVSFNPGAPFPLQLELNRLDTLDVLAPGPATIALTLTEGAPFAMSASLLAPAADLSAESLVIAPGDTISGSATVTVDSARAVQVGVLDIPTVPAGFLGVEVRMGDPLVLFGEDSNRWPEAKAALPLAILQEGGERPVFDLNSYFGDPDGDTLAYSAMPDAQAVSATVDEGMLTLAPVGEGEAAVVVRARDPDGLVALQRMSVTVLTAPDSTGFHIDIVFTGEMSLDEQVRIRRAAARWGQIVVADVPDVPGPAGPVSCGAAEVSLHATVDDLLVFARPRLVVGGKAAAAVCAIREGSALPFLAYMVFAPVLSAIEGLDSFESIAAHELAHTLGFGTVWEEKGLLHADEGALQFTGQLATAAYDDAGGTNYTVPKVPVHPGDGGHWYWPIEGELMSGYTYGTALSAITIQSIADLGYEVDVSKADPYQLPKARSGPLAVAGRDGLDHDVRFERTIVVDRNGRIVRVIRER